MIDETDYKIIDELRANGRATHAYLAAKLGISMATVSRRIENLVKNDVLRFIGITIKKLGDYVSALVALNVDMKKIDEICFELAEHPKVHLIYTTFGRYNVFLMVMAENEESFVNFIKEELAQIEGVKDIEIFSVTDEYKAGYCVFKKKKST